MREITGTYRGEGRYRYFRGRVVAESKENVELGRDEVNREFGCRYTAEEEREHHNEQRGVLH